MTSFQESTHGRGRFPSYQARRSHPGECVCANARFNARGEHLVYASPVKVQDLKTPAERLDALARLGQVVEVSNDETCHGLAVAVLGQNNTELISHLVRRHPSCQ